MSIETKIKFCGWACVVIGFLLLRVIQVHSQRITDLDRRLQAIEAEQINTLKHLNRIAELLLKTQQQLGVTTSFYTNWPATSLSANSIVSNLTVTNWTARPLAP